MQHNLCCHCNQKMCLAGVTESQAHLQTFTYVTVCHWTYHITVDLVSQNGNTVFGGH